MSSILISGDTSGAITLAAPAVSGTNTATLPAATGTVMVSGNMPTFSAYATSSTTLNSATFTLIAYQAKEFDTAGCYNNTGSTVTLNGLSVPAYAFCPNVAGYYQINQFVRIGGTTGVQANFLYKNGTFWKDLLETYTSLANDIGYTTSILIYLNGTGDYVQSYAYQGSGVNKSTVAGQVFSSFQGSMVRAA
jgi:hypothetical protein